MQTNIKLIHDDCFNILPSLDDESVDLILTDPPYGETADKTRAKWDKKFNYEELLDEYQRIIKDKGAILLFGNELFSSNVRNYLSSLYKYDIKWIKSKTTGFLNANYRPMNKYEDIMVFSKANASVGGRANNMTYNPQGLKVVNKKKHNHKNRQGIIGKDTNNIKRDNQLNQDTEYVQKYTNYPVNVVYYDNPKEYYHPTQKPTDLLEYLIKTYSNTNDTVLDTCMGAGSTGVACKNTNRNFIGIEIEEKYYKIAKDRINNNQSKLI